MKARQHYYFFISVIITSIALLFADTFLPEPWRKVIFQFPAIDTIGHLTSFFILSWVCHSIIKLSLPCCVLLLTFYAALTEVGQSLLGYRQGELGDFIADVVGICIFILMKWLYVSFFKTGLTQE